MKVSDIKLITNVWYFWNDWRKQKLETAIIITSDYIWDALCICKVSLYLKLKAFHKKLKVHSLGYSLPLFGWHTAFEESENIFSYICWHGQKILMHCRSIHLCHPVGVRQRQVMNANMLDLRYILPTKGLNLRNVVTQSQQPKKEGKNKIRQLRVTSSN